MAIEVNELWFVHSGGSANIDPTLDLGGLISSAAGKRVISQQFSALYNITGITINDAYGNAEGAGTLSFVWNGGTGRTLSWKPYGGSSFYGEVVDTDGTYTIGSSAGYMDITVVEGSLPGGDQIDTININNNQENVFEDVLPNESLIGKTYYRCLYLLNTNGADLANTATLWIDNQTAAGDDIAIGLDTVGGLNGVAATIGDQSTPPSGVSFSQPSSSGAGLVMGNIPTGQHYPFWIRRTVPEETRGTVIGNSAQIALSVLV
jgi:hypothetical protein